MSKDKYADKKKNFAQPHFAQKSEGTSESKFAARSDAYTDPRGPRKWQHRDREALEAAAEAALPVDETPAILSFDEFAFSPEIKQAITALGFTAPSPIQQKAIPLLLNQKTDFLGLAATGTGKTAAFGLPMLENLDSSADGVQALILCPTRELAKQVAEQMNLLARFKKTKTLPIYGGANYSGQLKALKEGVSVVVGTPGRIIDHLERGTLKLHNLKTVVLDEADEMISMGFKQEIERILETLSEDSNHNTWLFSATMSPEIRRIADQFLTEPKYIQINKTEMVSKSVQQLYYHVREDEKIKTVEKIIDLTPNFYGLIFCQTKALVVDLTNELRAHGYAVDCLHGDMDQNARERAMKAFKNKTTTVMICTDVASRGIDVKELTHVINYSLPREIDLYVHRIGRTGRGGSEGIALSLVSPSHMGLISRIERTTKSKITRVPVPSDAEVFTLKVGKLLERFINNEAAKGTDHVSKIREVIDQSELRKQLGYLDKEEIVARFIAQSLTPPPTPKAPQVVGNGGFFANSSGSGFDNAEPRRYNRDRGDRGDRGGQRFSKRFSNEAVH